MSKADLLRAWQELDDAEPGYREAEQFYDGSRLEIFASDKVRDLLQRVSRDLKRFNFARIPVTTLANRLKLKGMQTPRSEGTERTPDGKAPTPPKGDEAADRLLQQVWDANDMDVWAQVAITRACTFGDAYLMVWPVAPQDQEEPLEGSVDASVDDQLLAAGVDWTVHKPYNTRVMYDERTGKRKEYAITRWCIHREAGKAWRADLYYRDVIEEWWCPEGKDPGAPESWELHTGQAPDELERPDGFNGELENTTGQVPFFHLATDRPYGRPVHADAFGPQDMINKMVSMLVATTDAQGFPQRYGLLDPEAVLNGSGTHPGFPDDGDLVNRDPASLRGREGAQDSNMRSGPYSVQMFEGLKEYGQLMAASPQVYLEPMEMAVRMMAQLTDTPLHYFDPSGDMPSGESLKTAEAPLTEAAGTMQRMFDSPLSEAGAFTLHLLGMEVDRVEPRWAPVQAAVGTSDWEVVKAKQDAGVPQQTALVEAGYDVEDVRQWLDDSTDAMDLQRRLLMVQTFADAIQKIGAAVSTGFLEKESAVEMLNKLWPEAELEEGDDPEPMALPPGGAGGAVPPGRAPNASRTGQQGKPPSGGDPRGVSR